MTSRCFTVAFQGIEAVPIDVQVHIAPGLPSFQIVGLGDKAVNESRERIRAAFHSMNLSLPPKRVTVNLAPADFPKEGSHYDLAIALGILAAMNVVDSETLSEYMALGEVGLDGGIYPVVGVLPASLEASSQQKGLICPFDCAKEAAWSGLHNIVIGKTILDVVYALKNGKRIQSPLKNKDDQGNVFHELGAPFESNPTLHVGDFADVRGQQSAKRLLEIAAAGGHHILLSGPPGAGKSMLARRFIGILPPLLPEQALEVTMIHSLAGLLPERGLMTTPPYRDPHHSATLPALVGGGAKCRPGEMSLAHHGVLFLDELPEFQSATLESMRQPLETGYVSIARANAMIRYPAQVQLIAAMNPCKCGYAGNIQKQCNRFPNCAENYQNRISGPLMDRFDGKVYVEEVSPMTLLSSHEAESSRDIATRVFNARKIQYARSVVLNKKDTQSDEKNGKKGNFLKPHYALNAHLSAHDLKSVTALSLECERLLEKAVNSMHVSARGLHRILKMARTVADLNESESIKPYHLAEAIHYRGK